MFGKLKKFPYKGLFPFERFPFYDYELYIIKNGGILKQSKVDSGHTFEFRSLLPDTISAISTIF